MHWDVRDSLTNKVYNANEEMKIKKQTTENTWTIMAGELEHTQKTVKITKQMRLQTAYRGQDLNYRPSTQRYVISLRTLLDPRLFVKARPCCKLRTGRAPAMDSGRCYVKPNYDYFLKKYAK